MQVMIAINKTANFAILHVVGVFGFFCHTAETAFADHTGINVNAIFRVLCTDSRRLPSGILFRKV